MTIFTKENLLNDGMYVHYCPDGLRTIYADRKFVARFKWQKRNLGPFCTFLRKNFTVEEYFARIDAGENPSEILETKGYVPSHIKAQLRKSGYPTTAAGYKDWWAYQIKLADENQAKRIAREKDMATWTNGRIVDPDVANVLLILSKRKRLNHIPRKL